MKKLIVILILSASSAYAQSTNLVASLRLTFFDEAGVSQNTSINLDADESQGFFLNFVKDKQTAVQQTNTVPTFQNSIRGTTRTLLLKPLTDQAQADEWKTNKLDLLFTYGTVLRNNKIFTPSQLQSLRDVVNASNVATNLPAQ